MPGVGLGKERTFNLSFKYSARISLSDLKAALAGAASLMIPQSAVQALDVIVRHLPSLK